MRLQVDTVPGMEVVSPREAPAPARRGWSARLPELRTRWRQARGRVALELGHTWHTWLPGYRMANLVGQAVPLTALNTLRAALYRRAGFQIGPRVAFMSGITIIGSGPGLCQRLALGEGCLIGVHPTFNLDETITLGRNVSLGPNVAIYTSTHLLGPASRRMHPAVIKRPVVIEDGVWVGVNSVILPGVTIGRGSVVSAGSVVSEDVPPNTLVSGNPARAVQGLPALE